MSRKPVFTMFVDLSDKNVLVAGGTEAAVRRVKSLLQFTRNVTVITQRPCQELVEMQRLSQITLETRPLKRSDFRDKYMVVTVTNDRKLCDNIYRVCKEEGIYVNISIDRDKSDFYFPGAYVQGDLVIGVTAGTLDAKKALKIRTELEGAIRRIGQADDDDEA